jgi:hypothetical protein
MAQAEHGLSRNPNICASCSSLADGMDEPSIASLPTAVSVHPPSENLPEPFPESDAHEQVVGFGQKA